MQNKSYNAEIIKLQNQVHLNKNHVADTTNHVSGSDNRHLTGNDNHHVTGSDDESVTEVDPTVFENVDTSVPETMVKSVRPKPEMNLKSSTKAKEVSKAKPDVPPKSITNGPTTEKVKSNPKLGEGVEPNVRLESTLTTEKEVKSCQKKEVSFKRLVTKKEGLGPAKRKKKSE